MLSIIVRSIDQIGYMTALMFLFLIIFSLLFSQLFAKWMYRDDTGNPFYNFDTFVDSLISSFDLLTVENWNNILWAMWANTGSLGSYFMIAFLLILWIFFGNWILLNLVLAILLDAFLAEEADDEEL
jgi:hypothetical protein